MGCNVVCPYLPSKYEEDWGLDDPTGLGDEVFRTTIATIETKVKELAEKIKTLDLS
jgi:arsenate reductase